VVPRRRAARSARALTLRRACTGCEFAARPDLRAECTLGIVVGAPRHTPAMGEPFIGSEAVASGIVTPYALRSRFFAMHPDVYVAPDTELTA
jgi:hypothetical protein